jgi:ribosome-associated protein
VFVIGTGSSNRQVRSLADEVVDVARDTYDRRALRKEGSDQAEWVLLDYGDIVVHVFQPDTREFYDLERLWADAPRLEWVSKDPSSEEE